MPFACIGGLCNPKRELLSQIEPLFFGPASFSDGYQLAREREKLLFWHRSFREFFWTLMLCVLLMVS